jgi:hypothetical protein
MKKFIPQFSFSVIALIALFFLMGYTKPMPEEKQYVVISAPESAGTGSFESIINKRLSEGWHTQGGIFVEASRGGVLMQAMVK